MMPRYCDPENRREGSLYRETQNLDIKDIAKILRKQIKDAVTSGALPDWVYSVRIRRFSMGQALDVEIKDTKGHITQNVWRMATELEQPEVRIHGYYGSRLGDSLCAVMNFTGCTEEQARAHRDLLVNQTQEKLEKMRVAFNYDNSDAMVDYFEVNYYGHTSLDYEAAGKTEEAAKAAAAALQAECKAAGYQTHWRV